MVYGNDNQNNNDNNQPNSSKEVYSRKYKVASLDKSGIHFKFDKPTLDFKDCDYATGKLLNIELNGKVVTTLPVFGKLTKKDFVLYSDETQKNFVKYYEFSHLEQVFIYLLPDFFCFEVSIKKANRNENQILCTSTITERNSWIELFYKFKLCDKNSNKNDNDVSNKFFSPDSDLNQ